jgi:hypothetical protein
MATPRVTSHFTGVVLAVDRANRLIIKDLADPSQDRVIRSPLGFPHFHVIAGAGAQGWVTSVGQSGPDVSAGSRVATVGLDGVTHPFGPLIRDGGISSLAVSLDGRELAVGIDGARGGAVIRILPMPGFGGPRHSWSLPGDDAVTSLSWSPAGDRLSYVAGFNTGDGIGGPPSFLETASRKPDAPTTSPWLIRRSPRCDVWRGGWVDATGTYAVLEGCFHPGGEFFQVVEPATGRPRAAAVRLSRSRCDDADPYGTLFAAARVNQLLISWCSRVYAIKHHTAFVVPGGLSAAAELWEVPGG